MTDSVREHLLGYLLGALEDADRELVDRHLQDDAELRRELAVLRVGLEPLETSRTEFTPPTGLAERTCRFVASQSRKPAPNVAPLAPNTAPSATPKTAVAASGGAPLWSSRLRWQDIAVAVSIFVAASLLIVPAVLNSRVQARLTACQDNLRQIGSALTQYSQQHRGSFPQIPARGNLAAAGVYAPTLVDGGFLTDPRSVVCPASALAEDPDFRVPSLGEIQATTSAEQLQRLRRTMGGSYGYNLGYVSSDGYQGTKNAGRQNFALMADMPSQHLPERQSANHGGRGQNVLFENGRVQFVTSPKPNERADHFFLNDDGLVAPGIHRDDSVIGSSDTEPILPARND